jgi:hypothetical protein
MIESVLRPKEGTQDERGIIMATKMVRNKRKLNVREKNLGH